MTLRSLAPYPSSMLWVTCDIFLIFNRPSTNIHVSLVCTGGRGKCIRGNSSNDALMVSHLDDKPGRNAGNGALRRPEAGEEASR